MLSRILSIQARVPRPILLMGAMLLVALSPARAEGPSPSLSQTVASDLRVLIDVSGSMKRNDPKNLRGPALRLLTELIPEGNSAGIWTFGRYVNPQVRHGVVDQSWKTRALAESRNIHSRGLYTNIENALKIASRGWDKPDPAYKRHMILLTDGMVDVSENDAEDAASRQRILEEILPRLKQLNVAVHTLALSGEVDQELMRAFALATDGVAKQVDSAEQLQRAFLHIFEQSTHTESLPLNENRFQVDELIQDMTVLVFSNAGGRPTRLRAPDGMEYSMRQHPKQVRWHHEQSYDLITVHKPPRGEWTILSEIDPDNRVMVVTNLGMFTDPPPTNLTLGDNLTISTQLHEKGKVIIARDFLELVKFNTRLISGQGEARDYVMRDDGENGDREAHDGTYTVSISDVATSGDYDVLVTASSESFQREFRHQLQVYEQPFKSEARLEADGIALEVLVNTQIIKASTVSIVRLADDGVSSAAHLLNTRDKLWREVLPLENAPAKVQLRLTAGTVDGVLLRETVEVELPQSDTGPGAGGEDVAQHADAVSGEAQAEQASETAHASGTSREAGGEGLEWTRVIVYLLVGNILLFGGGIGAWLYWKRRRANADEQAMDDFDESVADLPLVEPAEEEVDTQAVPPESAPQASAPNVASARSADEDPSDERKPHPNMSVDIADDEEPEIIELPPLENSAPSSDIFGEDVSDDIAGDLADLLGSGDEAMQANVAAANDVGDDDLPVLDDVVNTEPGTELASDKAGNVASGEAVPGESKRNTPPDVDKST